MISKGHDTLLGVMNAHYLDCGDSFVCAYAETLGIVEFIKYVQFMLPQLLLNKAVIKLASIKQKVEEDVLGPFLMLPKFYQGDWYLYCLYPNLAIV